MIPKIIHQTAPTKQEDWHPVWQDCYKSWKIHFPEPEYFYILWNDEDLDKLVESCFPEYWKLYQSFDQHIIKIDFARFCMLYEYGGIYVDMDFYCYKNFYESLRDGVYLLESQDPKSTIESVQNCLMISSQGHPFFKQCMEICKSFVEQGKNKHEDRNLEVLNTCGPWFLTKMYNQFSNSVIKLPYTHFNPPLYLFHENFITKHMLTGMWGKETISDLKKSSIEEDQNYKKFLQKKYSSFRKIDYNENFDYNVTHKVEGYEKY